MLFIFHTALSLVYLIIAISSIIKFYIGWTRKKEFNKLDKALATTLLVTLYMQMLMGIYLFYTNLSTPVVIQNNSLEDRFWPVEHFFVMFFSILTAQIGFIYSQNIKKSTNKFKTLVIYYTISFILVVFSLAMILL